jgi:hypothetical protein
MICAEHCRKGERICSSSEELDTFLNHVPFALLQAAAIVAFFFEDELDLVPGFRLVPALPPDDTCLPNILKNRSNLPNN